MGSCSGKPVCQNDVDYANYDGGDNFSTEDDCIDSKMSEKRTSDSVNRPTRCNCSLGISDSNALSEIVNKNKTSFSPDRMCASEKVPAKQDTPMEASNCPRSSNCFIDYGTQEYDRSPQILKTVSPEYKPLRAVTCSSQVSMPSWMSNTKLNYDSALTLSRNCSPNLDNPNILCSYQDSSDQTFRCHQTTPTIATHHSDVAHRTSLIVEFEKTKLEPTEPNLHNINTTIGLLTHEKGLGQRSSLSGHSNRYLIHQSYLLSSSGSPSRLSLNSTGFTPGRPCSQRTGDGHKVGKYFVVMFDHATQTNGEISARKGDYLHLLDSSDPEWWLVEHTHSGLTGYIPASYVALADSVEAEDWYFRSISRKDSERLLLLKGNIRGTFLIRASETTTGALSLSVRDTESQRGETVKHYKIKQLSDTGQVCITTKQVFPDLKALVTHYSANADGLCCCLTRPCPRPPPLPTDLSRSTRDHWEIPRSSLVLLEQLGAGQFGEVWKGALSLSVRDTESQRGETVKHYKIKQLSDTGQVCITTKQVFPDLKALVTHYSANADGLCCCLTRPCPRPPPLPTDLSRSTRDHWEIPRSSLVLLEQLGAGQFGEVWKGRWNGSMDVAIKTLKPGTMSKEDFLKEARIMKRLHHPKLVRLYAVVTADPIYIVTELMSLGSLLHYLRDGPGRNLELKLLIDMVAQIASGMAHLEKERYIHRDLAARNVLVSENNTVKVADFGLARIIDTASETYTAKQGAQFPIKWTAPEAALLGRFTVKSDVWSFGIVIYEIITHGQTPYPSMNNTQTLQQVESGYRMPRPPACPDPVYQVMLRTWDTIPDKRPSFDSLCTYFEDYFSNAERTYKPTDQKQYQHSQKDDDSVEWTTGAFGSRHPRWDQWTNRIPIPRETTAMV
ncbi:hypothetical protein T265_01864 [Opisthorchis viverrini]|uniref:Tyrosine-protein kinase n=1 Tax=Opisthorchis viverrini TaxID=6198 RepID=A0A075A0Z1_OPIVI|nr:hypothetical protein T265_01864 [Opisthorchis viverrini]KER31927.1 hypothetical protein T265_01864 [Opisthorchis viverrini]